MSLSCARFEHWYFAFAVSDDAPVSTGPLVADAPEYEQEYEDDSFN